MSAKGKPSAPLSEEEIDDLVVAEADDDAAWETPTSVRRGKRTSLSLPAGLAARAAFLARLHHQENVEDWLAHIIEERLELEEAAFAGARQELAAKSG